jgi:uncharacterized protein YciW
MLNTPLPQEEILDRFILEVKDGQPTVRTAREAALAADRLIVEHFGSDAVTNHSLGLI